METVTVLDHGWHTDIGIPANELSGPLAVFRTIFPGARSIVFSFGKRTFLMAPADDWSEYLLGPVPGPAAILVTGLNVPAETAYGDDTALVLGLPPGGAAGLSAFVWESLVKDAANQPRLIDRGPFAGSFFYVAASSYSLAHTCNAWSAEALEAAGLSVSPDGVVLSGQVISRARRAQRCPITQDARP